jgi:uncharacterized protein
MDVKRVIATYNNMLETTCVLLGKLKKQFVEEADDMMSRRLIDSMLPLSFQIRFAIFVVYESISMLTSDQMPDWVVDVANDVRGNSEMVISVDDALLLISEAQKFLTLAESSSLSRQNDSSIIVTLPGGTVFEMNAEAYADAFALPQFYFHVVTAYALLRSNGVDIGIADYMNHLAPYRRDHTVENAGT